MEDFKYPQESQHNPHPSQSAAIQQAESENQFLGEQQKKRLDELNKVSLNPILQQHQHQHQHQQQHQKQHQKQHQQQRKPSKQVKPLLPDDPLALQLYQQNREIQQQLNHFNHIISQHSKRSTPRHSYTANLSQAMAARQIQNARKQLENHQAQYQSMVKTERKLIDINVSQLQRRLQELIKERTGKKAELKAIKNRRFEVERQHEMIEKEKPHTIARKQAELQSLTALCKKVQISTSHLQTNQEIKPAGRSQSLKSNQPLSQRHKKAIRSNSQATKPPATTTHSKKQEVQSDQVKILTGLTKKLEADHAKNQTLLEVEREKVRQLQKEWSVLKERSKKLEEDLAAQKKRIRKKGIPLKSYQISV